MALMKSFVSVVSPDMKAVITSGLQQLFNKSGFTVGKEIEYQSLIEILLGAESFRLESIAAGGQLTHAEFKDTNGNLIAYYNNGGWNECDTDAENARIQEFLQIYNDAWRVEYKSGFSAQNSEGMLNIKV